MTILPPVAVVAIFTVLEVLVVTRLIEVSEREMVVCREVIIMRVIWGETTCCRTAPLFNVTGPLEPPPEAAPPLIVIEPPPLPVPPAIVIGPPLVPEPAVRLIEPPTPLELLAARMAREPPKEGLAVVSEGDFA